MEVLVSLKVKKACGPDGITATILKCAPSIADALAEVFNISLAEGRLPSEWKESHVVPVFKSLWWETIALSRCSCLFPRRLRELSITCSCHMLTRIAWSRTASSALVQPRGPSLGVTSERVRVLSGVPQWSILGPLLFIITVDSLLRQSFSLGTSISMYADDIALYKALMCDEDRMAFQSDVTG